MFVWLPWLCVSVCVFSVDNQLMVRVTDTALSRDIFPNDYHCLGDNENRPVKWLALEALLDRQFSPAADVVNNKTLLFSLHLPAGQFNPSI